MSSLTELTEELLRQAAVFVAQDEGSSGYLSRFADAVIADAGLASRALDRALTASARAGNATVQIWPGDLRVVATSAGARLTACALAAPGGGLTASLRLQDADRHPVAGVAVLIHGHGGKRVAVTNTAGWVNLAEVGDTVRIELGRAGQEQPWDNDGRADGDPVITLPRIPRGEYELAAAPTRQDRRSGPDRWRVTAGQVDFLCQERSGGYDLTLLLEGVPADFAGYSTAGAFGVRFTAWGHDECCRDWIVPLAPRPLGLGGSLYGTNVDRLDRESVRLAPTVELLSLADNNLTEVVGRSVRHSDAGGAWAALHRRLEPGPLHTLIGKALTERENAL